MAGHGDARYWSPSPLESPTGPTVAAPHAARPIPGIAAVRSSPQRRKPNSRSVEDAAVTVSDSFAAAFCRVVLVGLSGILGAIAAFLASSTFATLLSLAPHADDNWSLKCTAAAVRFVVFALSLLRMKPATLQSVLVVTARLLTGAAIELSLLFVQPIFSTIAGGVFKPGDVSTAEAVHDHRQLVTSASFSHARACLSR